MPAAMIATGSAPEPAGPGLVLACGRIRSGPDSMFLRHSRRKIFPSYQNPMPPPTTFFRRPSLGHFVPMILRPRTSRPIPSAFRRLTQAAGIARRIAQRPLRPAAGPIKLTLGSFLVIASILFGISAAPARADEQPLSAWGKVTAGAKQLVRNPFKRPDKPNPAPAEDAALADEPKPRTQPNAPRSPVKQATFFGGKQHKTSRSISQYMAQERP